MSSWKWAAREPRPQAASSCAFHAALSNTPKRTANREPRQFRLFHRQNLTRVHVLQRLWRVPLQQRISICGATAYGVVVGGRSATALSCIVREDGAFSFSRGVGSSGPSDWTATGTPAARSRPDRISIRVTGTTATCAMNGRDLKTLSIGSGDVDGPAGLFIGAATHVTVSGFTTEAAGPRVLTIGG
jgi:hypothetical protein